MGSLNKLQSTNLNVSKVNLELFFLNVHHALLTHLINKLRYSFLSMGLISSIFLAHRQDLLITYPTVDHIIEKDLDQDNVFFIKISDTRFQKCVELKP